MPKQKTVITEFRNYDLPVDFPVCLLTGERWRISAVPSEKLHFHNCLEIGLCHEGQGILQIQDKNYHFAAGDITCIDRNIPHTTYSVGPSSLWSYLFTDPQELLNSLTAGYASQLSQISHTLNTACIIPERLCADAAFYFKQIIDEVQKRDVNYQLKARADFLSLFIELTNLLSRQEIPVTPYSASTLAITPALEYISKNYMTSFSMDYLSELCNLSPTHFRRIFSQTMGSSPLEYLNTVRITKACYLLRSTETSILNISEDVGFHSLSSFNRYFNRIVGMSPREYRVSSSGDESFQRSKIIKCSGWLEPEH